MEDYADVVFEASALVAQAVVGREGDLVGRCLDIDRIVQFVVRGIGQLAVEETLVEVSRRVVEREQRRGLGVDAKLEIEVTTLFGTVQIPSPYLRDRRTGETARPVHAATGLRSGSRLPAVERALTDFGAERSFGRAAAQFEEHYGFAVGRTPLLRLVESRAVEAEAYMDERLSAERAAFDESLATRPGVDEVLVELDGCNLRTGTFEVVEGDDVTTVRGLPKRRRVEQWREVRVGLARPLGEVERTYVAKMADYPTICADLFSAAVARGMSTDTQVIAVSAGGNGLREELDVHFADLRFILDLSHLRSHLYDTAEALGLEQEDKKPWVDEIVEELWHGRHQPVLDRLEQMHTEGSDRARRLAGYLRRFADAFDYGDAKERGWPIGSGEVESAHRYIPQERLKLPGAWWRPDNINPMLALRIVRANGWWDDFWRWQRERREAA